MIKQFSNGEIGQMRRVRENVCLLKERDANIVLMYAHVWMKY